MSCDRPTEGSSAGAAHRPGDPVLPSNAGQD
jgi:hypothetical protein